MTLIISQRRVLVKIFLMMVTSRDVVTLMMGLDLSSTTVEEENAPTSKSKN